MTPFSKFFAMSFALYAALLLDVALRAAAPSPWLPNVLMLIAFVAMQFRGGIGWTAVAGLMCDGLSGRPLGVTMLVATLTATVAREALSPRSSAGLSAVGSVFAFTAVVEAASRFIANTVAARPEHVSSLAGALQVAATTSMCVAIAMIVSRTAFRLAAGGDRPRPLSLAARSTR
jgi:rod shape-determining protein MreD